MGRVIKNCFHICMFIGTHDNAYRRGAIHLPALPEDFQLECQYACSSQEDALQGMARVPSSASGALSSQGYDHLGEHEEDNGKCRSHHGKGSHTGRRDRRGTNDSVSGRCLGMLRLRVPCDIIIVLCVYFDFGVISV